MDAISSTLKCLFWKCQEGLSRIEFIASKSVHLKQKTLLIGQYLHQSILITSSTSKFPLGENFKAKLVTPIDRRCSLRSPKLTVLFSSPICISILSSWTLMMSGAQHHLWSSSHLIKHLVNVVVGQATKINLFSSWAVV